MYIPTKHIVFGIISLCLFFIVIEALLMGEFTNAALCTLLLILNVSVWVLSHKTSRKCPHCGKLGAMETTKAEIIDRTSTTAGEHSKPATHYTFHIHRKCKYCGFENYEEYNKVRKH